MTRSGRAKARGAASTSVPRARPRHTATSHRRFGMLRDSGAAGGGSSKYPRHHGVHRPFSQGRYAMTRLVGLMALFVIMGLGLPARAGAGEELASAPDAPAA